MIWWLSWYQPGDDPRPLGFPPNENVLGWWVSGYRENDATVCALVKADTEEQAKAKINIDWPEAAEWRFCDRRDLTEKPLGDRFPLADWMRPKVEALRGETT
jgi:hypothetical protein